MGGPRIVPISTERQEEERDDCPLHDTPKLLRHDGVVLPSSIMDEQLNKGDSREGNNQAGDSVGCCRVAGTRRSGVGGARGGDDRWRRISGGSSRRQRGEWSEAVRGAGLRHLP